ncbi:hypothetical protein [Nocardia shimofusensis]|uniref:hypothetical protein n=1 Tax=Nocardia shimofusensis TaxID=228596 RepID=UPI0008369B3E|nr:hypothetical protein [Nocardia shimofusensis]
MVADSPEPMSPVGGVIPITHAFTIRDRTATDRLRQDNPHWPVRSPVDAAKVLLLHGRCPWHCSTRVAAILVSADDYRYFRDRGLMEGDEWAPQSDW